MKKLIGLFVVFLPWFLKRGLLRLIFGYRLHKSARIGIAWIFPEKLIMGENAKIDHFSVAIHLDEIEMLNDSYIGRSNWITGTSTKSEVNFLHQRNRQSKLFLGQHSAITKKHHIDCTNFVSIGQFSTVAGYGSQFLTHSINIYENIQDSLPISIGDYTFVGTNSVVLGGSVLPSYSVLGAKSLLNKGFQEEWCLYGGVPAKNVSKIEKSALYFHRVEGAVK